MRPSFAFLAFVGAVLCGTPRCDAAHHHNLRSNVPRGGADDNNSFPARKNLSEMRTHPSWLGANRVIVLPENKSVKTVKTPEKSRSKIDTSTFLDSLVSKDKLPWTICFVLSFIYLLVFIKVIPTHPKFVEGFCVTGWDKVKCTSLTKNSHHWAWLEDIAFTIAAVAFPVWMKEKPPMFTRIMIPFVIMGHGFLHKLIAEGSCIAPTTGGEQGFSIFVLALVALNILGFSSLTGLVPIVLWIAGLTMFIVKLTYATASNKAISSFFMSSQLLVSFTAIAFPKKGAVTPTMGWLFIAPVVVSLVEFLSCDKLVKVGGHAWYDFFLHIAVLAALFPKQKEIDAKK